ncbi:MAG: hypothetical protein NTV68_09425 [Methanomicrobiales archaeon]|nr:hypothetical protein [Methanomicrobiales archaeon]
MKFNTPKRGFFLVLIALCLTIVGAPAFADETIGIDSSPNTGLPGIYYDLVAGSLLPVTQSEAGNGPGLLPYLTPVKIPIFSSHTEEFTPLSLLEIKPGSQRYTTLRESYMANPRPLIWTSNAQIRCIMG